MIKGVAPWIKENLESRLNFRNQIVHFCCTTSVLNHHSAYESASFPKWDGEKGQLAARYLFTYYSSCLLTPLPSFKPPQLPPNPPFPFMSGGYIGSKISLISRSDIRYVGILHTINSADSTVALEQVRSFGTEGRRGNPADEIPPSENVFEYIVFRGSDVKDLHVCEAPAQQTSMPQVPNDPAILGTTAPRAPNFQGFPPPLGVQPPNFPTAQLNPYYIQQAAAAAAYQQQQQHFWQQPPITQQQQLNLTENPPKEAEQPKPPPQKEHAGPDKPEDYKIDGTLTSSKNLSKPSSNTRSTVGQQASIRSEAIKEVSSTVAVEKLVKKVSELSVSAKETNGDRQSPATYDRPSSSVEPTNNNNSSSSSSITTNSISINRTSGNSTSNNRLPGMGGHLVQQNRRGRGGRRSYNQNYDRNRIPVPASDFDFESSNAKFNKDEIVKEVVKKVVHDVKEEESIETHGGTEDEEEEDVLIPPAETFYNKAKSFFDNISCETKERLEQQGPDGRRGLSVAERRQKQSEERRLNLETFGQVSIDGGRYRGSHRGRSYRGGRGNYRGRGGSSSVPGSGGGGGSYRGSYSNSFRGNSYRSMQNQNS
ncbi:hypothetical protein G9A89_005814 [Geosiphon pyriformis]|nr:hypothetical protein G9A89_005814 [Geosiphon pyriformis]